MRPILLPLVVAGALVGTGCAAFERESASDILVDFPDPTTPLETDDTDTDATGHETVIPIAWEDCGRDQCATVTAPVDYDDPDGATIDLHVRRRPATGDRIGPLFVNFGGPGADAAGSIGWFPFPAAITERFDIVGMDPRGVGESTVLDCGIDIAELYAADPTIDDEADAAAFLDVSQRYVDDCATQADDLLPHVGTRNVARDMDLVRAAMGDNQLNYLGFSYGTAIGQAYADLFPNRVRAMILDGIVDPAPSGIESATGQAEGFETALGHWAADCPSRSTCPFDDPVAVVDDVLARAEEGIAADDGVVGPGEAPLAFGMPLYRHDLWPRLDRALVDALDGDGTGLASLARDYMALANFSIYFAVSCLDSDWPRDTDEFMARAKDAAVVAPLFGEAIVIDYLRCALWPVDPDPLGPITAPDAPPILVVSTTGDPATPHANGIAVAARLASGVLVTFEGDGHGVVFQDNACVNDIATRYLLDLDPPSGGATC